MARRYSIYDVFTDKRLAGNPLAVIFDGDGLDDSAMQAIAREMNLSETVFVQAGSNGAYAARLRIFTPGKELPFAGHPTVGTAVALAERSHGTTNGDMDIVCVLEENVGPVRCAVRLRSGEAGFAEFDLPKKPWRIDLPLDRQGIADALSVKSTDIGFENHVTSIWSAGVPFLMIPLHNLATVQNLEFDPVLWEKAVPLRRRIAGFRLCLLPRRCPPSGEISCPHVFSRHGNCRRPCDRCCRGGAIGRHQAF